MFKPRVKLEKDLYERCKEHAERAGFSSVEGFIKYTLEKELGIHRKESDRSDDAVTERLKSLGYLA